jgi:delta8-fatty-acid desaturase
MMTKHRIGRVELPWANLPPPIRSEDYYVNLAERKRLAAAPETEKSRRGRSVDLGSVRLPPLFRVPVISRVCNHTRRG